jgi:HEAT repeat protein
MSSFFVLAALLYAMPLSASSQQEEAIKKINAALLIRDPRTALELARHATRQQPNSKELQAALIRTLAKTGDEKAMMAEWDRYRELDPDAYENHALLEEMAWGIIDKGSQSSAIVTRAMALLAGFFTQTYRGVNLVHKNLNEKSALLRGAAVQLSCDMRDDKLKQKILQLAKDEKNWEVRMQAIEAIGKMRMQEGRPVLMQAIAGDESSAEERAIAIQSLVSMLETADRDEVVRLAQSDRAGLRLLACEVVASLNLDRDVDLMFPLLRDASAEVRMGAILAIGLLRPESVNGQLVVDLIRPLVNDPDYHVNNAAAWLLTIYEDPAGAIQFRRALQDDSQETRLYAASALASTGRYGLPLMRQHAFSHPDPYVRMNLSLGLIGQREATTRACRELANGLVTLNERWSMSKEAIFRGITPNKIKHRDDIPQYPELENQKTRLEIVNLLASLRYPGAQDALKKFLKERVLGFTGIAMAMVLQAGDQDAQDLVKGLLNDPDPRVSVQAALILALWSNDEEVIALLENVYPTAERDLKEKILEAVGQIGSDSSVPFLVDSMREPHQNLRIIGAACLLMCLNH